MNTKIPATAVVLTYNEERNLPACLEGLVRRLSQVIVVDSFSTDRTIAIAEERGVRTYQHEFINQAKQYIWAMDNCAIENEWVVRVDADERWTEEALDELERLISADQCDGINVRMKIYFMGRWLRRGGMYPNHFLRAYKRSKGTMEDRWMDEHIRVAGRVHNSEIDVLEQNYDRQKNIALWTQKHNGYSTREALENLLARNLSRQMDSIADLRGERTARKRWLKENAYSKAPLFARPALYFGYRYFLQLGVLEGVEGMVFHTLHAFWYRFLVDAKIYQIERIAEEEGCSIPEAIERHWGIRV